MQGRAGRFRGLDIGKRKRFGLRLAVYRNDARRLLATESILDPDRAASIDAFVRRHAQPPFDNRLMVRVDLNKFDAHTFARYVRSYTADGCEVCPGVRDPQADFRAGGKRRPGLDEAAGQTQIASDDNHVVPRVQINYFGDGAEVVTRHVAAFGQQSFLWRSPQSVED